MQKDAIENQDKIPENSVKLLLPQDTIYNVEKSKTDSKVVLLQERKLQEKLKSIKPNAKYSADKINALGNIQIKRNILNVSTSATLIPIYYFIVSMIMDFPLNQQPTTDWWFHLVGSVFFATAFFVQLFLLYPLMVNNEISNEQYKIIKKVANYDDQVRQMSKQFLLDKGYISVGEMRYMQVQKKYRTIMFYKSMIGNKKSIINDLVK